MRIFADKKLTHTILGEATEVELWVATYSNGRIALQLMAPAQDFDGLEPYMTPSVNMADEPCPPNEVFIKDWSENEGIAEWLHENGIICWPHVGSSNRAGGTRRYRLTPEVIEQTGGVLHAARGRRQRGFIIGSLMLAATLLSAIALVFIAMQFEHLNKRIDMATCASDIECQRACEALELTGCRE